MTDDTDSLMRDFRSYCTTKKANIETVLKEDYGKDSPLPGKALLEKAVRLMDTVMVISDPMTFYKRVYELYDDFEEVADQMVDLNGFLGGSQKEKYLKAYRTLQFYEASKNYISDEKIIDYAKQIKRIMTLIEPYSFIKKLEEYDNLLTNAIAEMLDRDAARIKPDIEADKQLVQEALIPGRPYTERLKGKFLAKFDELLRKLEHANDMAKLNGIPAESSALVQNCLNEINREETAYQDSIQPPEPTVDTDDPIPPQPPIPPVIKQKPISFRALTRNKTYSIKSEADIDAFLQEMRKSLMAELDDNTIIRLS